MKMNQILELYERGVITKHEALNQLFDRVTVEELESLPESWRVDLKSRVDEVRDCNGNTIVFAGSWSGRQIPPNLLDVERARWKKRRNFLVEYFAGV
jgi:hypothetical protein